MAPLIVAVKSTFEDLFAGRHDKIRETWGQELRGIAHLKFFVARSAQHLGRVLHSFAPTDVNSYSPKSDEIILDALDDRRYMVQKVRAICQYVMDKYVSHALFVDVGSKVNVKEIQKQKYLYADYAGYFDVVNDTAAKYPWAQGRFGYFLSRAATMEIAETSPDTDKRGISGLDDVWVGQVMGPLVKKGDFFLANIDPVCNTAAS